MLTQVCIIIGQFCNDPAERKEFSQDFEHAAACLVHILMCSTACSPLSVKAMFALKQICLHSNRLKMFIQSNAGTKIVEDYFNSHREKSTDFYNQATLLLQVLCQHRDCCVAFYQYGLTNERLQRLLNDEGNKAIRTAPDTRERIVNLAKTLEALDWQMG